MRVLDFWICIELFERHLNQLLNFLLMGQTPFCLLVTVEETGTHQVWIIDYRIDVIRHIIIHLHE